MGESGLEREAAEARRVAEAQRDLCAPLARAAEVHAVEHASSFIGLTEEDAYARADQLGLRLRLISLDEPGAWTDEFVYGRVCAYSRSGVITEATPG